MYHNYATVNGVILRLIKSTDFRLSKVKCQFDLKLKLNFVVTFALQLPVQHLLTLNLL